MPHPPSDTKSFPALVEIIAALRGPQGCPWDIEQTHASLVKYAMEEAHEFADAVENKTDADICEELGDMLLQVVLNAQVAKDRGAFDIHDVIHSISKKMIERHPHVFADEKFENSEAVRENWDKIKNKNKPENTNPFASIPISLPSLQRSQKIGHKSIRFNFDWNTVEDVVDKVDEEFNEVREAIVAQNPDDIKMELGDLLFAVAQLARHLDVDAEQCLRGANQKFEKRFAAMCEILKTENLDIQKMNVNELEVYWAKAKAAEKMNLKTKKVLFICVQNSARSQMAEGLGRHFKNKGYEFDSAGSAPAKKIHPMALQAMSEIGIDIKEQKPTDLKEIDVGQYDRIIALCAEESCPALGVKVDSWALPDPANRGIDPDKELEEFRKTRDFIRAKIESL